MFDDGMLLVVDKVFFDIVMNVCIVFVYLMIVGSKILLVLFVIVEFVDVVSGLMLKLIE